MTIYIRGEKMKIIQSLLTPNKWSRPQKCIKEVLGIVIHWTANPKANAEQNRNYFESRKKGNDGYGSAHYIIGQDGVVVQCIPTEEVAYHCGSSQKDPASNKIYTDYARKKFKQYAENYQTNSPNYCTIGIELCPTDNEGHFTNSTIQAAVTLCARLCKRFNLKAEDITTHHAIVGWKDCPRLWVRQADLLNAFRVSVSNYMERSEV